MRPSMSSMYVGANVVNRPDRMYKTAAKLKLAFLPYLQREKIKQFYRMLIVIINGVLVSAV